MQSKELGYFYASFNSWLKKGEVGNNTYSSDVSLYDNVQNFTYLLNPNRVDEVQIELLEQYVFAGLDSTNPFPENKGLGEWVESRLPEVVIESQLQQKIVDYNEWLLKGAPENGKFKRFWGLCSNFRMSSQLHHVLLCEGLDETFPFSDAAGDTYSEETSSETCHLNVKRIQWIKDHLPKSEA